MISKKKVVELIDNKFEEFNKISNGNLFEVDTKLRVQEEINKQNLASVESSKKLTRKLKAKLNKYNIDDFYLLQLQANYYCNTIKYSTNNYDLKRFLPLVIRLAFIDGMSGFYYDAIKDKLIPIYLGSVKYNEFGELEEVKYTEAFNVIFSYDWLRNDNKILKTIKGEDCKNIAIFKWGEAAISSWLIIWKFVQFQNQLLRMLNSSSFVLAKKFVYYVENQFSVEDEMDLFFDPDVPFLKINKTMDLNNKLKVLDNTQNIDTEKVIEYYRGVLGIYYGLLGRKINQDAKKERNLQQEVETNEANFTILEREWLVQFELFADKLKLINPKFDIEPHFTLQKEMEKINFKDYNNSFIENEKEPEGENNDF